ncbi:MAG TPA: hypothetical protein VL984_10730 [Acidimicrobiales bacterium]|nr:hypothetical protein [Acidimicrobiales bacterium]
MLADQVDVVIGVDTHKYTHTAAVVVANTGAVVEDRTVNVGPDGYQELLDLADHHSVLRAWAVEEQAATGPASAVSWKSMANVSWNLTGQSALLAGPGPSPTQLMPFVRRGTPSVANS